MKKVLIISYYFPPRLEIGAQRFYRLGKYFPQYGWEPVVLTANLPGNPPEGIRVIETDCRDTIGYYKERIGFKSIKGLQEQLGFNVSNEFYCRTWKTKIIERLKEVVSFPDDARGWYNYAIKEGSDIIKKEVIDIMISTSPPVTTHLIANHLKQIFKIPWVADLRDLWTQNHYYHKSKIIKYIEKKLEVKTLKKADALVTVTQPWVNELKMLHKNKHVLCITNGYDPDEMFNYSDKKTGKFSITYTGTLYYGKRDPSLLFNAISELIKENKIDKDSIEVNFYSPKETWLTDYINGHDLNGVVKVHGLIPREQVLVKQRESQLQLLLLWNHKGEKNLYPAKVFEYLAAGRPIIAVGGPRGIIRELIKETNSGRFSNNLTELKQILREYYQEFMVNGEIKSQFNENIHKYSYKLLAKSYADTLNSL